MNAEYYPRCNPSEIPRKHDEVKVIAKRLAEAVVAVGELYRLAGLCVAAALVPGDQGGADVQDRHADGLTAMVAGEVFGGGEQRAA